PVNTSTIFSLRLVLNIVPRLPLKLRGAKSLDLQGANLQKAVGFLLLIFNAVLAIWIITLL
ncbi:hypothetical protein ACSZNU_17935, partial [Aeromonas hydrophila]